MTWHIAWHRLTEALFGRYMYGYWIGLAAAVGMILVAWLISRRRRSKPDGLDLAIQIICERERREKRRREASEHAERFRLCVKEWDIRKGG